MIESHLNKDLEEKIDRYVNGQLSTEEIDELWAELIQDENQLDYLKTVANTKAVIESQREQTTIFGLGFRRAWAYAAAAVIALLVAVLAVINIPDVNPDPVEPIASIELDYYRSGSGVVGEDSHSQVLKTALSLANRGQTSEAIDVLEAEVQSTNNSEWLAELHLNLGSIYYNNGRYQEAIESFQQVVDTRQVDVLTREKGYWYLGNSYFQLNQLDEARQAIESAYELDGAYRRVAKHYLDALASA
ncbi:MAG: tetratricopeptide repeat protein [Balneolaceae bacterium]|nr:tetratricopeptide repeat protein [Balneolaceae bacterium]